MTAPHEIVDEPTAPLELEGNVSRTTQFMRHQVDQFEKKHGRAPEGTDFIQMQQAWDDYKDARFMRRVRNYGSAIGIIGAAIFGVWIMFGGKSVKQEDVEDVEKTVKQVGAVTESVDERIRQNSEATAVNAENVETIAEMLVEQQQLTVESTNYVVDVVKAGPRHADDEEKPESLKTAEKEVDNRKKKAAAGELLKKLPGEE